MSEVQPTAAKKTRQYHTRRAHTSALENADNIAQLVQAGMEIPFIIPAPFAEKGKATYFCSEGHKARLEIYNCLPEDQKPFYDWTLQPFQDEKGSWWVEVRPSQPQHRKGSASAKSVAEALRLAVAAKRREQNPEAVEEPVYAPPRTTDDVLKQHGYF